MTFEQISYLRKKRASHVAMGVRGKTFQEQKQEIPEQMHCKETAGLLEELGWNEEATGARNGARRERKDCC